jgi:four helix bundle protein
LARSNRTCGRYLVDTHKITKPFPKSKIYGLTSQMRRAAVSIPSNIVGGNQRNSIPQFVSIARGSLGELKLETQIILSPKLDYLDKITQDNLLLKTEKRKKK